MAFFAKTRGDGERFSPANLIICPMCDEEYDDPKCLPCMHVICLGCLSSLVPLNSLILKCPIDKQELPMPKGGVNALPSDMKIVRLLELSSGGQITKKKRTPKKKAQQPSEEGGRRKSVCATLSITLEEEAAMVKRMITEAVDKIRAELTAKENEMIKQVDIAVDKEVRRKASTASNDTEPEPPPSPYRKDSIFATLPKGKTKPPVPPKRPPSFILDLTPCRKLLQVAREDGLGSLQFGRKKTGANPDQTSPVPLAVSSPTYGGATEVTDCINLPNRYKRTFNPTAVAASHDGHVAISDYGSECVLLFDTEGEFVKKIGEGDCNEAGLEGPDGLAYLPNNNLVVSDSPLEGIQALKMYDCDGNYISTLVEQDEEDGISFGRLSSDPDGRLILTCSGEFPCVRVYDSQGNLQLEFGDGILNGPQKAIFHDDKFFVSDTNVDRHKCNIKMFDNKGKFVFIFDDNKLHVGEQDSMGLDVIYPIHIT